MSTTTTNVDFMTKVKDFSKQYPIITGSVAVLLAVAVYFGMRNKKVKKALGSARSKVRNMKMGGRMRSGYSRMRSYLKR